MGDLALSIAAAERWPSLAADEIDAFVAASDVPLALFFMGAKANRRETDDVAVVLRELDRSGQVRAALIGEGEGAAKRRFGVVAAPSLTLVGQHAAKTVPLIADWSDYRAAIAEVGGGLLV
jgi:Hydrogenase-1 expression protein HyaE